MDIRSVSPSSPLDRQEKSAATKSTFLPVSPVVPDIYVFGENLTVPEHSRTSPTDTNLSDRESSSLSEGDLPSLQRKSPHRVARKGHKPKGVDYSLPGSGSGMLSPSGSVSPLEEDQDCHTHLDQFCADTTGTFKNAATSPACGGGFLTSFVPKVFHTVAEECLTCVKHYQTIPELRAAFSRLRGTLDSHIPKRTVMKANGTKRQDDTPVTDAQQLITEMRGGVTNRIGQLRYLGQNKGQGMDYEQIAEMPGSLFALWIPAICEAIPKKMKKLVHTHEKNVLLDLIRCADSTKEITNLVKWRTSGLDACVAFYEHYFNLLDRLEIMSPKGECALFERDYKIRQKEEAAEQSDNASVLCQADEEAKPSEELKQLQEKCQRYKAVLDIVHSAPYLREGNPCGKEIIEAANQLLKSEAGGEAIAEFKKLVAATASLESEKEAQAKVDALKPSSASSTPGWKGASPISGSRTPRTGIQTPKDNYKELDLTLFLEGVNKHLERDEQRRALKKFTSSIV